MEPQEPLEEWMIQKPELIKFESKLGRGRQGSVFGGCNSATGEKYAIKVIKTNCLNQKERQRLYQEIQTNITIATQCQFKHFPKFYGFWKTQNQTNLVFEKCEGNALEGIKLSRTPSKSYSFAYVLLFDILQGLQFLDSKNILHRDLKPENILLDKGMFKICDLGLSKILKQGRRLTVDVGNIISKSPQFYSGSYDCKTDIWSLGINVFLIAFGSLPFSEQIKRIFAQNSVTKLVEIICNPELQISFQKAKSTHLNQIIKSMLEINRNKRLSASQILQKYFSTNFNNLTTPRQQKMLFLNLYLRNRSSLGIISNYYLIMLLLYQDFTKFDKFLQDPSGESIETKIELIRAIKINIILFLKFITRRADSVPPDQEILSMIFFYLQKWSLELGKNPKNKQKMQKNLKQSNQALELHRSRVISDKFPFMAEAIFIYEEMQKGRNVFLWELRAFDLRKLQI